MSRWKLRCISAMLLVLCPLFSRGQGFMQPDTDDEAPTLSHSKANHIVNFGIKGGFTSSLFLISDFNIDGISISEVQNNYKIGYFGSFFVRINFDRHFLQPELSYNINRCNITFNKPQADNTLATGIMEASITSSIHSIDIPVIYGYNFIKEGPYGLAVFGGPKIRYIWNKKSEVTFKNFEQTNIHEELRPLNLSLTLGVAVTISRIFFDFRYDMGLHNISKRLTYDLPDDSTINDEIDSARQICFQRRDNVLSFSLGVFF